MRTTIRIDDDLYRRVKAHAARSGRTVGEVIEDAVRVALRPRRRDGDLAPELPTFGGGGTMPGVALDDSRALADLLDDTGSAPDRLDALR